MSLPLKAYFAHLCNDKHNKSDLKAQMSLLIREIVEKEALGTHLSIIVKEKELNHKTFQTDREDQGQETSHFK